MANLTREQENINRYHNSHRINGQNIDSSCEECIRQSKLPLKNYGSDRALAYNAVHGTNVVNDEALDVLLNNERCLRNIMNPNPNKETPEQELLEEIRFKIDRILVKLNPVGFDNYEDIDNVREQLTQLFATHYKAREAEILWSELPSSVELFKNVDGSVTCRYAIPDASPEDYHTFTACCIDEAVSKAHKHYSQELLFKAGAKIQARRLSKDSKS